ncbi:unnamed protein product [Rotaria sp. Silwood2]|nr:unnamed protein product [Rotaria sp. Silwood2]
MSFSFLPVIDLKSNPNDIRQSLLLACSTTGFFYISNHGLNSLQSRMFSLTKEFFCLSHNEKRFYSPNTTSYQGYLKIGHETLDTTNSKLLDGAHSDYGSLTLIFQHDNKSGLEVFDRLTNVCKGMIKSTIHRVIVPNVNEENHSRFSIAFFCDPNGDTLLTPLPSKLIENHIYTKDEHANHIFSDYDNNDGHVLTAGEHLQMRLNKTHVELSI